VPIESNESEGPGLDPTPWQVLRSELAKAEDNIEEEAVDLTVVKSFLGSPVAWQIETPDLETDVESLLQQAEVLPSATLQTRLTRSVQRALEARRVAPLAVLLETKRLEADLSVDELSQKLSISPAELQDLEIGQRKIWQLGATEVARWVRLLKLGTDEAMRAAREAVVTPERLALTQSGSAAAEDPEEFLQELERQLKAFDAGEMVLDGDG
jgi:hypothetical protein